jgi:hypothetical protein
MSRLRCCPTVGVACLLAALPIVGTPGEPPPSAPFVFPKGESVYFFSDHLTGASLFEFRADGTFREISREHMFIAEWDAGSWSQQTNGEVLVCSRYRYSELGDASLHLSIGKAWEYARLPELQKDIASYLGAHADPMFPAELLEVDWPYGRTYGLLGTWEEEFSRADLQAIHDGIPGYLERSNLFRFEPRECGGCVYLLGGWPADGLEDDGPRQLLRDCAPKSGKCDVEYIPFRIDAERFAKEIGSRQPFVHFPEMNDIMGSTATLDDMKGEAIPEAKCGCFPCEDAPGK